MAKKKNIAQKLFGDNSTPPEGVISNGVDESITGTKTPLSKLRAETGLSGKPLLKEWMKRKRSK